MAYYPERRQTLWAAVSRAVRTPTRGERDITLKNADSATSPNLILNQGSPNFTSEKEVAYELGYRFKPTSKLSFDLSTFYNQYSNLRTLEPSVNGVLTPVTNNMGHGSSYGFEFSSKWQATRDWKLEGSYEHFKMRLKLDPNSKDNRSLLAGADDLQNAEGQTPQSQIKLRSFYNVTQNIEFDNIFYYVDRLSKGLSGSSLNRATGPTVNNAIPAYTRFDTRIGYAYTPSINLSVGIQNLFDRNHSEFKKALYNNQTQLGRTFYFRIVWQH